MLIFYGSPGANINCTSASTTSWDTCIDNCEANSTCFLAYSSPSVSCYYCGFGGFPNITYSSSETDYTFALKTEDVTECDSDLELLQANDFDKLKLCPSYNGWSKFTRENYVICAQRLYDFTNYLNKAGAVSMCSSKGGSLLGFENQNELTIVSPPNSISVNKSLYIGLESVNSVFTWTDPWLTGAGVLTWATGHPKTGYNCASMQYTTALIQSENCTATKCSTGSRCTYSVFCGFLMK